jgi:RNA polymerase sigma-70 factor, ECF subfamily
MISVSSMRRALSSFTCLHFATDGTPFHDSGVPARLFAGIDHPPPSREDRVIDLYDQLRPALLTYLGGLGLAAHEAEDIIHDCFVRLFDHLAMKEDDRNLRGWLFRVAHNLAMDLFREGQRIQHSDADGADYLESTMDPSSSPEEHAIQNDEIRRVRSALSRLTQQQRAAILLRAEELRYREIASVLGISTKRVSELVQRALVLLAGDL